MSTFSLVAFVLAASSSKSTTTSSSGVGSFLFIIVIFGALYFFFLRPRAQAAKRQRTALTEISVGDEVLTGAGIFGRVLDIEADRVTLETAPGTRITVLRSTIARRITEDAPDDLDADRWDDDDHDEVDDDHEESHEERGGVHGDADEVDDDHDDHDDHNPDGAPSTGGTGQK